MAHPLHIIIDLCGTRLTVVQHCCCQNSVSLNPIVNHLCSHSIHNTHCNTMFPSPSPHSKGLLFNTIPYKIPLHIPILSELHANSIAIFLISLSFLHRYRSASPMSSTRNTPNCLHAYICPNTFLNTLFLKHLQFIFPFQSKSPSSTTVEKSYKIIFHARYASLQQGKSSDW